MQWSATDLHNVQDALDDAGLTLTITLPQEDGPVWEYLDQEIVDFCDDPDSGIILAPRPPTERARRHDPSTLRWTLMYPHGRSRHGRIYSSADTLTKHTFTRTALLRKPYGPETTNYLTSDFFLLVCAYCLYSENMFALLVTISLNCFFQAPRYANLRGKLSKLNLPADFSGRHPDRHHWCFPNYICDQLNVALNIPLGCLERNCVEGDPVVNQAGPSTVNAGQGNTPLFLPDLSDSDSDDVSITGCLLFFTSI